MTTATFAPESLEHSLDSRLERDERLFDAIENILRLQKSRLVSEGELSRVEQVRHYDHRLVQQTMRDPRLFKRDPLGTIRPERMYDNVPRESFDTYENRFAVALLRQEKKSIDQALLKQQDDNQALPFLKEYLSFGSYGTIHLLRRYLFEDGGRTRGEERMRRLLQLSKRAALLQRSPVARLVAPMRLEAVEPTNLLLQQKDYRTCFDFHVQKTQDQNRERQNLKERLERTLADSCGAVWKDGRLDGRKDGRTYGWSPAERLLTVLAGNRKAVFGFDIDVAAFFPELLLTHEGEKRSFPLGGLSSLTDLVNGLTLLLPSAGEGLCPICHTALSGRSCPHCHAEVEKVDDATVFVENVPFVTIGGKKHA